MKKLKYPFICLLLAFSFTSCEKDDNNQTENSTETTTEAPTETVNETITETPIETITETPKVTINETQIIGSWELIGYEVENGQSNITVFGETTSTNFSQTGSNFDYVATFSSTPNTVTGNGSYDVTTTYIDNEGVAPITTPIDTDDLENPTIATWEIIDGNKLVTTANGVTSTATIQELTDEKLVYISDLSEATPIDSPDNSGIFGDELGDFDIETSTNGKLKTTFLRISK